MICAYCGGNDIEIDRVMQFFTCLDCYVKERYYPPRPPSLKIRKDPKNCNLVYFRKMLDKMITLETRDARQVILQDYQRYLASEHYKKLNGRYFIYRELLRHGYEVECPLTSGNGQTRNEKLYDLYINYKETIND